jgi:hypothetical protein
VAYATPHSHRFPATARWRESTVQTPPALPRLPGQNVWPPNSEAAAARRILLILPSTRWYTCTFLSLPVERETKARLFLSIQQATERYATLVTFACSNSNSVHITKYSSMLLAPYVFKLLMSLIFCATSDHSSIKHNGKNQQIII